MVYDQKDYDLKLGLSTYYLCDYGKTIKKVSFYNFMCKMDIIT